MYPGTFALLLLLRILRELHAHQKAGISWNASAAETADCPASIAGSLHNILAVQLTRWPWLWSSPSPPSDGRNFIMALPLHYDSTEEAPYCRFKKSVYSQPVTCGARMIDPHRSRRRKGLCVLLAQHIAHKRPSARSKYFQSMLLE